MTGARIPTRRAISPDVPKLWGASLRGALVVCMRNIFILNEIWAQHKMYVLAGTSLD
jgi:hypothetical protein